MNDPRLGRCANPYHEPEQVNGGAPHNEDSARTDIDAVHMAGFVATAERPGGRACGLTAPICESSAPPDVVRPLCDDVRNRGAAAVRELTLRFDGVDVATTRVPQQALDDLFQSLEAGVDPIEQLIEANQ